MKSFRKEKVLQLHEQLINKFGGLHGVKNDELLESALNLPFASFGGEDLYITVEDKIATLTYSIISNHSMNDGNKRLGISLMILLCLKNDIKLIYTQKELIDLGLNIASGKYKQNHILDWIKEHRNE